MLDMSIGGRSKFLQNIGQHLGIDGQSAPDINLKLNGYLLLTKEYGAEQLIQNQRLQTELGAQIELLSPAKVNSMFPWVNTDEIVLAAYGVRNEGWFDPWALLMAFKAKAQSLGANYMNGEVIGFNLKNTAQRDSDGHNIQTCNEAIIRQSDGTVKTLAFGTGIVCCGAFSGAVAKSLGYGSYRSGVRSVALPIEPRKRYVFVFQCNDGPDPTRCPLVFDTSSIYFRPEGKGGNYLSSLCPIEAEEPSVDNLDVDYSFFENTVWPQLAHRVKAFESIKLKTSWAGLYDYNTMDQNASNQWFYI
ncbi:unnamed protein product, partial [Medioppia subpectinata]